jgi:hypothetical protein
LNVENRHRLSRLRDRRGNGGMGNQMPEVTVVYWRDIPAQVIVGKGRQGSKVRCPNASNRPSTAAR